MAALPASTGMEALSKTRMVFSFGKMVRPLGMDD
jgi:hypothetical protein